MYLRVWIFESKIECIKYFLGLPALLLFRMLIFSRTIDFLAESCVDSLKAQKLDIEAFVLQIFLPGQTKRLCYKTEISDLLYTYNPKLKFSLIFFYSLGYYFTINLLLPRHVLNKSKFHFTNSTVRH